MLAWIKANRLLSIILLICIGFFVYYLASAIQWTPYRNSIDYVEGLVMGYAKLWANGMWKWDVNIPPYLTMAYGIGLPVILTPLIKLFGVHLWVGRAVSFFSAIIVCYLVYCIVKRITGNKVYGIIGALLPATQPIFREWSFVVRADMPSVMFSMLGIYLSLKYKDSKKIYWAIIPFVIAVMTKQIAVAGVVAVLIYLLIHNWRRFFIFSGLLAVGFGAVITPLMIISDGTYFNHVIVYMNTIRNFDFPIFADYFMAFMYPFIAIFILSLIYLRINFSKKNYTLESLYFLCALVVGAMATLRSGSGAVYYMEAIIAGSISASLVLPYLRLFVKRRKLKLDFITIACSFVVLFLLFSPLRYSSYPDAKATEAMKISEEIMGDSNKPIVTENPAMNLNMGKDVYIEPFVFTNMARLGYWDETSYVNQYKTQYFDYVLLRVSLAERMKSLSEGKMDGHFTNPVLEAIDDNYTLVYESENKLWVYSIYIYEANEKLENDKRFVGNK